MENAQVFKKPRICSYEVVPMIEKKIELALELLENADVAAL